MLPDQKPAAEIEKVKVPLPVRTTFLSLLELMCSVSPRLMYLKTWSPDGVSKTWSRMVFQEVVCLVGAGRTQGC